MHFDQYRHTAAGFFSFPSPKNEVGDFTDFPNKKIYFLSEIKPAFSPPRFLG
jgi:hypothetical protein